MSTSVEGNRGLEALREFPAELQGAPEFIEALRRLTTERQADFDGVSGGARALLAAALAPLCPGVLVVLCPQDAVAADVHEDWRLFGSDAAVLFPAWQTERVPELHDDIYGERLRGLKRLLAPSPPQTLFTSLRALRQPTPSREMLAGGTRRLRTGETLDVDELAVWLVEHRFHRTSAVAMPGEFSHRGGILDIFAPEWNYPVRIDFWDTQIESMRRFDPETQRSIESVEEAEFSVLRHGQDPGGLVLDYLPESSWVLWLEPHRHDLPADALEAASLAAASLATTAVLPADESIADLPDGAARELAAEQDDGIRRHHQAMQAMGRFAVATASAVSEAAGVRMPFDSVEQFSGDVQRVREELDALASQDEVILLSDTDAETVRLRELLADSQLMQRGGLQLARGNLSAGFRLRLGDRRMILLSSRELFLRARLLRGKARRHLGKAIDSFMDLREGDLVVHLAHGIARYRGLELLDRDGRLEEHMQLEFDGRAKVYVPVDRIGLVQKYIGGSKTRPRLSKIGGKQWVRQKKAAESAVLDMAADMLELQANRSAKPGIAFQLDSIWQQEFEASFPYDETPDQLGALEAIRGDMQKAEPMDRLLCGDVGFGKTEVAMRAAFKAVDNGYQVAVLVPTTILAEQHYRTFTERMAAFPFRIARLSRFGGAKQQREVIKGLKEGQVDIVIGTHRVASKDVQFQNLGLVVIDEEQRFGVDVKERLKSFRSQVDVLTLSATPIPRTLHMSLVGVRDISNLETAPEERIAVETKVSRFSDQLIRDAIMRELQRDGQIYFVHNRVHDIQVTAAKLARIAPEARIGIAHGQMHEDDLEHVMMGFIHHDFDLLLATTIVESGLDIPNANTIFIDQSDNYGLADLHQLRGRVGRYKNKAYCYLLIDPRKTLTPNAARRLRAIEEFSEMGAGFAISMRDLEIRGAGNLLGTQQSGHIAAVGYELYCQLLETAVRKLKNKPLDIALDTEIELPGEAHLPDDYVDDMRLKIDLYRRLSRINAFPQLDEFLRELTDRFGPPPPAAMRMLEKAELRLEAALWQLSKITLENDFLVFRYRDRHRLEQLVRKHRGKFRIVDEANACYPLDENQMAPREVLRVAKSVLRLA
ncbi:MAG: transcription-repair coupling factor [Planctomycetales bacterium]|nr:transcription-repair coupling factor [Planctomycetales bacterium]